MDCDKAKDIVRAMRPRLLCIINDYKRSGNGSGQRAANDEEWGHFDLSMCVDGDDRKNFLHNDGSEILYWWHVLDEYQMLRFTTSVLSVSVQASAERSAEVAPPRRRRSTDDDGETRREIAVNLGSVGSAVQRLSYVSLQREISTWESRKLALEDQLDEMDQLVDRSKHRRYESAIAVLDTKIRDGTVQAQAIANGLDE